MHMDEDILRYMYLNDGQQYSVLKGKCGWVLRVRGEPAKSGQIVERY